MITSAYLGEYDAILRTMQCYVDGGRQGSSALMRPAFHEGASFIGYVGGELLTGTETLFAWIDRNGPAPEVEALIASVEIADSIAVVRLEAAKWTGKLAGDGARMSDLFTLLKTPAGWKIVQKAFHWHA